MVNGKRRELPAQDRHETKRLAKSAVAVAEAPSQFSKVAPALANTSPAPSSDSGGSDTSAGSAGDGMEDAVDFAIASMDPVMAAQFEFGRSAPPDVVVAARAAILPGDNVSAGITAAM
eukprot:jgi/Tetstr1/440958/TSEL_029226.t1